MTNNQKESILKMRLSGMSASQISDKVGLPRTTVTSYIARVQKEISPDQPACKHCGKPITVKKGYRQRLFCSDYCRLRHWRKKQNHEGVHA